VKRLALSLLAGFTLAVAAAAPATANFTVTDLGTLGGTSQPLAINDAGQVVGGLFASTGASRAFLWQGDIMTDLNSLIPADSGWVLEVATAINQAGHIVGLGKLGGKQRAFLWQDGQLTDLGTLGGISSRAFGINNLGQVVGCSAIASSAAEHAFVWQNGAMTNLNRLIPADSGWVLECASAINDAGHIVGTGAYGQRRAFVWQNGRVSDLGTWRLWGGDSQARGINNVGQIVGNAVDFVFVPAEGEGGDPAIIEVWRAFLWQTGTIGDLGMLGVSLSAGATATGINNSGHVVGSSFDPDDLVPIRAFRWTSVGGMVDLNNLIPPTEGWRLEGAVAINKVGQIVGTGLHNGQRSAFLLTPPPKPPDVAAPTWANGTLAATGLTSTSATLTWRGAQDDVAVTGYRLFVNGGLYATPAAPPTTVGGLTPGTIYVFKAEACDAATNCSKTGPALTVTTPLPLVPNLVMASLSPPPASARLGGRFNVTDAVKNAGTGPARGSTTRYYLSADPVRSANDQRLTGSRAVSTLAAGSRSAGTATVTIPGGTPRGRYVLLACADDFQAVAESNEADNCRASAGTVQVR
jgi:probable HAF family extracellular repeat protein